ncbi:hypothetical protein D3C73_1232260 [compost metagenome]
MEGQSAVRLKGLHFPFPQQSVEIPGQITVLTGEQLIEPLNGQEGQAVQLFQTFQQHQRSGQRIAVRLMRTFMRKPEMRTYCSQLIGGQRREADFEKIDRIKNPSLERQIPAAVQGAL